MAAETTSSVGTRPQSAITSDDLCPLPSPSATAYSKHSNPLTAKIAAILSTTYSDGEFREALSLLDDRGIKNDAKTRRQLRLEILKEVIDSNGAIIDEFGRVAEQLHRIRDTLGELNAGYNSMKAQVLPTQSETLPVLAEAASLLKQRDEVGTRQNVLTTFKRHFIMSEDEVKALTSTAEPVEDSFFNALSRAKMISQDCEILLGFEKQTLGSDLMEQTSKNIDLGFQKLYNWVQREFRPLNLDNSQMKSPIRRALRVLAERPSLFQNCLNFFAEARERIISNAFHAALTGGKSRDEEDTPYSNPIDLIAYDPLRYVGDMFAWIHSAMVGEREALEVLFVAEGEDLARDVNSGRETEIWRLVAEKGEESDFNALQALSDLIDRDIAGASRILRQRVEQVIHSNEEAIIAYRLVTIIGFYRVTVQKLVGTESNILGCVKSLETEAFRQFRALIRDSIVTLHTECQPTTSSLGPPNFVLDALSRLEAIMETYEISLSASQNRESEFELVLFEALDPFLSACEDMAASMTLPHDAMFLINCKTTAAKSLIRFDFTRSRATKIHEEIEREATRLVVYQYGYLRDTSGLNSLLKSLDDATDSTSQGLKRHVLEQASQKLNDFLPSALMDAQERLKDLLDLALAREITESAADKFCTDFEELEVMLEEADEVMGVSDEPSLRSVFPKTTAEIRVLLS